MKIIPRFMMSIYLAFLFPLLFGCKSNTSKIKIYESSESKSISDNIPSKGKDALQNWLNDRSRVTENGHVFKAGVGFMGMSIILYSDNSSNDGVSKIILGNGDEVEVSNFRTYIFNQDVDAASKLNGVTKSFVLKFQADAARTIDKNGTSDWFNISRAHFLDTIILSEKKGEWTVEIPQGNGSGIMSNQWDVVELIKPSSTQ